MTELVRERLATNLERLGLGYLAAALDEHLARASAEGWA